MSVTIYENVSTVIDRALLSVSTALEEASGDALSPDAIELPAVEFSAAVEADIPENPSYAASAQPTALATGTVDDAAYTAASSVVGVFEDVNLPTNLDYGIPVRPDAMPNVADPQPDLNYPESPFINVQEGADLREVTAPVVNVGEAPEFQPVPPLEFDFEPIEPLDLVIPPVADIGIPDSEILGDPEQLIVTVDPRLLNSIKNTLAGDQGNQHRETFPIIFDQAIAPLVRTRDQGVRQAFVESAAKGHSQFGGALAADIDAILEKYDLAEFEASEKARDEVYKLQRERLVEACTSAIALETANFQVHLAYCAKLVEVFEYNIALHISLFNGVVAMYNAQLQAVNAVIESYNIYLDTLLTQQRAESAELAEARAIIDTNRAKVTSYSAQVGTVETQARIYTTEADAATLPIKEFTIYVEGLSKNLDIARANVEAYSSAIRQYSSAVEVDKAKIAAYRDQVSAEGSVTGVYTANWDLYSTALRVAETVNTEARNFNNASLQALNAEIGVFSAAAEQQRSYIAALNTWVSTNNSMVADHSRALQAAASYSGEKARTTVALENARLDAALAVADTNSLQSALEAQRNAAQAQIDAGLLISEATTYAGLAQSAYAIRSVSASLGASASEALGYNYADSASENETYGRSYSYTKSRSITA